MSQNISAARDSTSSPPHNDSKQNIHPPQPYSAATASTTTANAPTSSSCSSFTSQQAEAPGHSTVVGSPAARPRERALDVSTILNPSPQRRPRVTPYGASRRPSLVNINSPSSPTGFLSRRGPSIPSRLPSPIEVDPRRAPSVPLPGPGPIRRHARNSLPGVLGVQDHPFPALMSPPRGSPAFRAAGLRGAPPGTPPAGHPAPSLHPPPVPPPSLQQQIASGQSTFSSPGDAYTYAPGYVTAAPHSASADASPRTFGHGFTSTTPSASVYHAASYAGGIPHQGTMPDQGGQIHQGHYGMGLGGQHGSTGHVMVNTPDGAMVAPLDITSGSMAQHEKRRKNASASSRFRKRKKEKEIENSRRMEELEHNLKKTEEERDRIRQERDYYRELILHAQRQGGQLPPLPQGLFESTSPREASREEGHIGDTGTGGGGMGMGASGPSDSRGLGGMGSMGPPAPEGDGIGGGLGPQSPRTGDFSGSQMELQHQQHPHAHNPHNLPSHHPQQQPPVQPEPQPPPQGRGGRVRGRGVRGTM